MNSTPTYKSNADIEGGSATNSNSAGGSLGMIGSEIFMGSTGLWAARDGAD